MDIEVILVELLIVSAMTGLATEALKILFDEHGINYYANTLAGCVSLVLSLAVGIGYIVIWNVTWSGAVIVWLIALIFLSWLCAMVGYDKVVQTITQIKTYSKREEKEDGKQD